MIAYIDSYITEVTFPILLLFFGTGHATKPCSVSWSVGRYVHLSILNIFERRAKFALLLLPNCLQLDCRAQPSLSLFSQ